VFEDQGNRRVGQRADLDRAQAHGLDPGCLEAAEQPQHTETGLESLFGVRPPGHHRDDQRFGVWADAAGVAL